jgi:hypothetical protein
MASFAKARSGVLDIFDALTDSDDEFSIIEDIDDAALPVTSSSWKVSTQTQPVLGEVTGNSGVPRPSADDLATQLEDFHIVTPGRVNKARGLKPRPTIDLTTFNCPSGGQENWVVPQNAGDDNPAETAPEGRQGSSSPTSIYVIYADIVAALDNFTQDSSTTQESSHPLPDSTQLAKHQEGQFDYVLTLPAVPYPGGNETVKRTPESEEDIQHVQFGCNLVCCDGTSDIVGRQGSDSKTTYTLIATPIESTDEIEPQSTGLPGLGLPSTTINEVAEPAILPGEPSPSVIEGPEAVDVEPCQRHDSGFEESTPLHNSCRTDDQAMSKSISITECQVDSDEMTIALNSPCTTVLGAPANTSAENLNNHEKRDQSLRGTHTPETECNDDNVMPLPELMSLTVEIASDDDDKSQDSRVLGLSCNREASASQPAVCPNHHERHQLGAGPNSSSRRTSEVHRDNSGDVLGEIILRSPAPSPNSRIEDSVEALDKLELQIEIVNDLAQFPLVTSKSATVSGKPVRRSATISHHATVVPKKQAEKTAPNTAIANKRLSIVSRPSSLAPPKPLVRSSKPPTVPAFELSGDKVAQRLKEKRLARLSMSMPASAQSPNRTVSPAKPKTATSTKPPTRPTFELTSAAITRRKAEERAAKLKAEQEEERKRREFKARPIPTSVAAGAAFPRQTAASLARMSLKGSTAAAALEGMSTATTISAKRHSTIGHGMSSRPSLAGSTTTSSLSRGRAGSTLSSATPGLSRSTSRSTGSVRGSSVSVEEKRGQRMRGKEIFKRESSFVSDKERERRSREEAAKKAREEAAERSKLAARQWAEEQRAKKAAKLGGDA